MRKKRSDSQILSILKQAESGSLDESRFRFVVQSMSSESDVSSEDGDDSKDLIGGSRRSSD